MSRAPHPIECDDAALCTQPTGGAAEARAVAKSIADLVLKVSGQLIIGDEMREGMFALIHSYGDRRAAEVRAGQMQQWVTSINGTKDAQIAALRADNARLVEALDKANQYVQIADNFEEIEIDGEMCDAFEVRQEIAAAIAKASKGV